MIAEGTYPGVAIDRQWGTAGNDNKRQIAVTFKLLEGPSSGQSITWFGYFTEKTWERTSEALRYCGWEGDDLSNLGPLDQKVDLVIAHEDYEGKTTARVQWVNKIGGGKIALKNPMSDTDVRKFAAMMKSKVAAIPVVKGERVSAAAASAPASAPVDDGFGDDRGYDEPPFNDEPPPGINW